MSKKEDNKGLPIQAWWFWLVIGVTVVAMTIAVALIISRISSSGESSSGSDDSLTQEVEEVKIYNGINQLEPGGYVCTNNGQNRIYGYISYNGKSGNHAISVTFREGEALAIAIGGSDKLGIDTSRSVDITCIKQ